MADINQKLISILSQLSNSLELGFSDDEVYEFIVNKFKRAFNVKYGFGVAFDRTLKGIELVEGSINIGNDVENVDEVKSEIVKKISMFDYSIIRSVIVKKELIVEEQVPVPFNAIVKGEKVNNRILCIPVLSRKKVQGVLVFCIDQEFTIDEEAKSLLMLLAKQMGGLMSRRQVNILTEVSKRNAEFFNLLKKISNASHEMTDFKDLASLALEDIAEMMDWSLGFLMMPEEEEEGENSLKVKKFVQREDNRHFELFVKETKARVYTEGVGLTGHIMSKKGTIWLSDVDKEDILIQGNGGYDMPLRYCFGFPMIVLGKVLGVLEFYSLKQKMPDEFAMSIIQQLGEQLGVMAERMEIEALKKAKDVAEKSSEFKSTFLATMSHEIRTPMNGILGMVEILHSTTELSDTQEDYIQTIKKSGEDLLTIINDILDLSKIEAGKMNIMTEPINIRDLVKRITDLFSGKASQKGLTLECVFDDDLPNFIDADEHRIGQVLGNLISNGIKNTVSGGVTVKISVDKNNKKTIVPKFEVIDNGRGIMKNELNQLFKKYCQLTDAQLRKHDGSKEGTGLGLTICKNLAELMGGNIGVESEFRKGATFWFTIKANKVDEKEAKSHIEEKKEPTLNNKHLGLKIMVAEDKIVNQKVIQLMLKGLGCEVDIVNNGEECLFKYRDNVGKYDLILMDIQMPIMDGLVATNELKLNFEQVPPIIGLSANGMEGDKEYYIYHGLDEYLSKPVKVDELFKTLKEVKDGLIVAKPFEMKR